MLKCRFFGQCVNCNLILYIESVCVVLVFEVVCVLKVSLNVFDVKKGKPVSL